MPASGSVNACDEMHLMTSMVPLDDRSMIFPEAEIGRLKEQVSLVVLAEAAGVTLRKAGRT
jgi:hypothetical protein